MSREFGFLRLVKAISLRKDRVVKEDDYSVEELYPRPFSKREHYIALYVALLSFFLLIFFTIIM